MKMSLKNFKFRCRLSQNSAASRSRVGLRSERLRVECLEDRLVLAAPMAADDVFQATEGQTLAVAAAGVLANDTDADGDTLSATLVANALNGSVVFNEDGSFSYTPDPGFVGTDTFTYRAVAQSAIPFTIDQSQSNVNMSIALNTDFGSDTDNDSSRISGTAVIRLDPTTAPFENIQITQLNLNLVDGVNLDFCLQDSIFGCLAGVKVTAAPGDLNLEMEEPGPPTTVDPAGAFAQTGNSLRVTGTVNLDGTGLANGQVPEGDMPFDTAGVITPFEGTITQAGQTLTLSMPIGVVDVFDLDGQGTANVNVQGTIVATAPVSAGTSAESNIATVTIEVGRRFSASDDLFRVDEDQVLFISPGSLIVEELVVATGSSWRYLDDGSDQATAWRARGFDDSGWSAGSGELGYGDGDEVTTIGFIDTDAVAAGIQKNITTYFRQPFELAYPDDVTELVFRLLRDDGAAVYLNGVEIIRDNLISGAVFDQPAIGGVSGADESAFTTFVIDTSSLPEGTLRNGNNVLAVEIHQSSPTSSDISFDLSVTTRREAGGLLADDSDALGGPLRAELLSDLAVDDGVAAINSEGRLTYQSNADFNGQDELTYLVLGAGTTTLVAPGSDWRYLDDGSNQGTAWQAAGFDDNSWAEGPAQLGYGDDDQATTVGFGDDAGDKFVTTYFRQTFDVADVSALASDLVLNVLRDDGVAVYLNGTLVGRDNLAADAPFDELALVAIGGAGEETPVQFALPASLLNDGENTIAVEIHQAAPTSSDISFDLWLTDGPVSLPATVRIVVDPVNDAPVAEDSDYEAEIGTTLIVDAGAGVLVGATDIEGDMLNAILLDETTGGPLLLNLDGSFAYAPTSAGTDSFTYRAVERTATSIFEFGSQWRYLDDGSDQTTAWRATGFDDSSWPSGRGELGYGDGDEVTTVDFVDTDAVAEGIQKNITTYFRREFEILDASSYADVVIELVRDDGAAVYLNGVEVGRSNLASGAAFDTPATTNATGDGQPPVAIAVDAALLQEGTNVIAVEVHQVSASSSDVSFDLRIEGKLASNVRTVSIVTTSPGLPADFDNSGTVDRADLAILAGNYGLTFGATKSEGDANLDGRVDLLDLARLRRGFGESLAVAAPAADGLTQQITSTERTRSVVATRRIRTAGPLRDNSLDARTVDHVISSRASRTASVGMKLRGRGGRLHLQAIDALLSESLTVSRRR